MGEGKDFIVLFAGLLCKSEGVISTPLSAIISGDQADLTKLYDVRAIMADLSLEIYVFNQKTTIQEFLGKEILDSTPRITKEQFYSLD